MSNCSELEERIKRLEKQLCCLTPKFVDELPDGKVGNGFVIYQNDLYYWNGTEWVNLNNVSSLSSLPVYLNDADAIADGLEPGDLYLADPLNTEGWDEYSIRQVQEP